MSFRNKKHWKILEAKLLPVSELSKTIVALRPPEQVRLPALSTSASAAALGQKGVAVRQLLCRCAEWRMSFCGGPSEGELVRAASQAELRQSSVGFV